MNKWDVAKIVAFVALIAVALSLVWYIDAANDRAESELVRDAVKNAALTCYAVEGAYPDSVEYLKENYHLAYDESRYYITYEAFASNLIPDIWVTERGAGR